MSSNIADLRAKQHLAVSEAGGTKTLAHFFQANKTALASLLPKHVTPERMMRLALNAVRTTPGLMDCSVESIYGGVVLCAQLGVEPNTPLGHAYLIPFKNRQKGTTEAQFILGYKGMLMLARQSGEISSIDAQVVYSNDHFEYEKGLSEKLVFKKADGDRGEFRGCYIVVRYKDGGHWFDWLSAHDILARREKSQGYRYAKSKGRTDNPWMTDFDAMARKTVVRASMPWLPISTEKLAVGVAYDSAADNAQSQHLEAVLGHGGGYFIVPPAVTHEQEEDDGEPGGEEQPQQPREHQSATPPEELPPEAFPVRRNGKWIDANGEVYDEEAHAWSRKGGRPVCNQDGSFRARRGSAQAGDGEGGDDEIPGFDLE